MMEEKIIAILREVMEDENINTGANQENTENWDSMHQLMLVSELEDAFDISLEPEEIAEMKSVADIQRIISGK